MKVYYVLECPAQVKDKQALAGDLAQEAEDDADAGAALSLRHSCEGYAIVREGCTVHPVRSNPALLCLHTHRTRRAQRLLR